MEYKPYKKNIKFSEAITSRPEYSVAMKVIRSTGDMGFRNWLLQYCEQNRLGQAESLASTELFCKLESLIGELVSREVSVDVETLDAAFGVFYPSPDLEVIELLIKMYGSLLDIQKFERKLRKVEEDLSCGAWRSSSPQTRSGDEPNFTPRGREWVKYKGS